MISGRIWIGGTRIHKRTTSEVEGAGLDEFRPLYNLLGLGDCSSEKVTVVQRDKTSPSRDPLPIASSDAPNVGRVHGHNRPCERNH